jgi:hypothetical protein
MNIDATRDKLIQKLKDANENMIYLLRDGSMCNYYWEPFVKAKEDVQLATMKIVDFNYFALQYKDIS